MSYCFFGLISSSKTSELKEGQNTRSRNCSDVTELNGNVWCTGELLQTTLSQMQILASGRHTMVLVECIFIMDHQMASMKRRHRWGCVCMSVHVGIGILGALKVSPVQFWLPQVLSPGSKSVTLFGYSLSGNLDVDNNHYPDLAVGSLSDSVFVYR